ncbi:PadR family transcriptional regulator [Paenibacillus sedimenti]|uniref:PadR family transcriptional regulator n=1 Tax=Paenibacillus sedimenti TaxID=2770274 RepID=A0A926QJQ5_9BACL|nr:PadR family transcriptional regulator [Paenibacillus sedimenti]MBD0380953.1 PadR family transcriptional regulator [Paenibacillus sedimenti]
MSTVRLLVLGSILRKGISHGYAVFSDITSWRADTWTNVKPGSIYHALDKLESQGMIRSVNSEINVKLGPSRKEYAITQKGGSEFIALLESALVSVDIQQLSVGIAFMDMLPRQRAIGLLQQCRIALERSIHFLKSLPTDERPTDPSKHPELVGIWVNYVENEAATTERILVNVQAGKYEFKSDLLEGE